MPGGELSYQHRASGPGDVPPSGGSGAAPRLSPRGIQLLSEFAGVASVRSLQYPQPGSQVWALSPLRFCGPEPWGIMLRHTEMQWDGIQAVLSADRSSLWQVQK